MALCEKCNNIPLDLFLPTSGCGHTYHTGKAWLGYIIHSSTRNIEHSASGGCPLCRMMLAALSRDKTVESIPEDERFTDTQISLRCVGEGNLSVIEHTDSFTVRTGELYWFSEDMNLGQRPKTGVAASPSARSVFDLAKRWITTCQQQHAVCNSHHQVGFVPTRLIDISTNIPRVILTESNLFNHRPLEYVALSHCWGTQAGGTVLKTTTQNLQTMLEGIPLSELSKTFKDTIQVTKSLGFTYLWIDSLCILQDSAQDFEIECALMGQVYLNAVCTIAASSSPNSSAGLIYPRDPSITNGAVLLSYNSYLQTHRPSLMTPEFDRNHATEPLKASIQIYQNFGPFLSSIQGPLSARGWTLQERELAPRVLHYTTDQVLFECRTSTASETSPSLQPKTILDDNSCTTHSITPWTSSSYSLNSTSLTSSPKRDLTYRLLDNINTSNHSTETLLKKWYTLLESYSRRQLTVPTDILPALSGLASLFSSLLLGSLPTNLSYSSGLWTTDILKGLSWYPDPILRRSIKSGSSPYPPPPRDPSIPSWSWASFPGPICFFFSPSSHEWSYSHHLKALQINTVPAGKDPFGRVRQSGFIKLSGYVFDASIVTESQHEKEFRGNGFRAKVYSLKRGFKYPTSMRVYFDADADKLPEMEVKCLMLGSGLSPRGVVGDVGLVLRKDPEDDEERYKRVGMFDVEGGDRKWVAGRKEMILDIY
ncbi:heterokaryon incompatibility protein-domain-containing protein [Cladorrhinum sp. PSN259]|nr:heterokaryon incompatibility protein-domain-containing protein [Cladorrhinum sp. PSN259]